MRYTLECLLFFVLLLAWWILGQAMLASGDARLPPASTETFRLTAYNVTCFTSPETNAARATVEAYVTITISTQHRRIDWQGSCRGPGPTPTPFPVITWEDGTVHEIVVAAWPALNTGKRLPLASSLCYHTAESGYAEFRCLASEKYGAGVAILVSIAASP